MEIEHARGMAGLPVDTMLLEPSSDDLADDQMQIPLAAPFAESVQFVGPLTLAEACRNYIDDPTRAETANTREAYDTSRKLAVALIGEAVRVSLISRAHRRDMLDVLRFLFAENFAVYGIGKVWRQMMREGFLVARCTIERLMRDMGLQGVIRGKPVRTTISDKAAPCPLDQVNRRFYAPAPNMLWVSDFTSVATWAGFVYVAFVIDLRQADRGVAGEQNGACQLRPRCPGAGSL